MEKYNGRGKCMKKMTKKKINKRRKKQIICKIKKVKIHEKRKGEREKRVKEL